MSAMGEEHVNIWEGRHFSTACMPSLFIVWQSLLSGSDNMDSMQGLQVLE